MLNAHNYYIKSTEYDADSPETLFSSPWTIIPKIKALKKLDYTADDSEPDSFVVHKEESSYKLFYIFLGVIMGICFGGYIEHLIIGLIIGIILGAGVGFSIGYSLDMREKTHRRSIERTGT